MTLLNPRLRVQEAERLLKELAQRWRETAAEIVDVNPPKDWPTEWAPPLQSPENKAYCDGKARGLTLAADELDALVSRHVRHALVTRLRALLDQRAQETTTDEATRMDTRT